LITLNPSDEYNDSRRILPLQICGAACLKAGTVGQNITANHRMECDDQ